MRDEYDFSAPEFAGKRERGKFYRKDARFILPVHLEPEIQDYFDKRAQEQGVEMSDLINDVLRKEIADKTEAAE